MVPTMPCRARPCDLHVPGKNRLLTMLADAGEEELVGKMERVSLKRRASLISPDKPITHVHFPLSGVASQVVNTKDGPALEVATIGNEGMVGVPILLGATSTHMTAFVQVEGDFLRLNSVAFAAELRRSSALVSIGQRYVQAFIALTAQSAACVRFHQIDQRLCRWILHSQDRVEGNVVALTQEFLALMLGVQRPGVSLAAAQLQHAGLIKYRHGMIEVLDRAGIEEGACDCYAAVRDQFERLLC
jgi:CRP-like cAMP-binding protein